MAKLIEHHTHYKEIHGYDKTIWLTKSEHVKLHIRLRKESKCNVPVDELHKISSDARERTDKRKKYIKKYNQTDKRKECIKKYSRSEHGKKIRREYQTQNIRQWVFSDVIKTNVKHIERIRYNKHTGNICIDCGFRASTGKKLYYIIIDNKQTM